MTLHPQTAAQENSRRQNYLASTRLICRVNGGLNGLRIKRFPVAPGAEVFHVKSTACFRGKKSGVRYTATHQQQACGPKNFPWHHL